MGGGKAHFGQRGQKSPKLKKMVKQISTYGPRGTAHRGPRGAAPKDLEARRQRTLKEGAVDEAVV